MPARLARSLLRTNSARITSRRDFFATLLSHFRVAHCVCANARVIRAAEAYMIVDSQTGYVLEKKIRAETSDRQRDEIATAMVVLDWAAKRGGDLIRSLPSRPKRSLEAKITSAFNRAMPSRYVISFTRRSCNRTISLPAPLPLMLVTRCSPSCRLRRKRDRIRRRSLSDR